MRYMYKFCDLFIDSVPFVCHFVFCLPVTPVYLEKKID
jgi:hypothetical protein